MNCEIVIQLEIFYEMVKEYVQYILNKIGVVDWIQVVIWVVWNGFV